MVDHDRTGIFRWLVFVALAAAVPLSAHAYEPTMTLDGELVRWFVHAEPIPFHTAVVPRHRHIPVVDFPMLVQAAYDQWSDRAPCSTVPVFVHGGTTNATSPTFPENPSDIDNLVVFVTSADEWQALGHSSTVLAVTYARYLASTGELFETDIAVNAGTHVFSVDDAGPEGTRDLVTVIQHETGHALGLAHSTDVTAAMHAGYPEPTLDDPLPGRRLAEDDLNGICASYSDVPLHVPPEGTPPALHHDAVTTVVQGEAAPIEADISDDSGVALAFLHYRADSDADFTHVELVSDGGGRWRGEIPSTATDGASVAYYLSAFDGSPQSNMALDPPGAPDAVHRITVLPETEPADADAVETSPSEAEAAEADAVETSPPEAEAVETSPSGTEAANAIETSPEGVDEATIPDASAPETSPGSHEGGCAGGMAPGDGDVALVLLCAWLCLGGRRRPGRSFHA